jgi:curved DNA-binding protein
MTVKPSTQVGTKLRLRGKGLPKDKETFGDLYLTVTVEFPETISDEAKALWKSLAEESDFHPRG